MDRAKPTHGPDGRFTRGGGGRPKGSRNKVTVECEAVLEGEAEIITRRLVELAKAGDPTAIRICIERLIPLRKGRPLQGLARKAGEGSVERLLRAVLDGEVTPEEGQTVVGMIESAARVAAAKALAEQRQQQLEVFRAASAKGLNGPGIMLVPLPESVGDWERVTLEAQRTLKEKVRAKEEE